MKVTSETICTDPWKFGATATTETRNGPVEYFHIGEEGESRAVVKRLARKGLEAKLWNAGHCMR